LLENLFLLVFSLVSGLGGLALTGWLAITGQATTFDGLFLTFVALGLSLVFLLNASWTLRSQEFRHWWESRNPSEKDSKAEMRAEPYPSEKQKTA